MPSEFRRFFSLTFQLMQHSLLSLRALKISQYFCSCESQAKMSFDDVGTVLISNFCNFLFNLKSVILLGIRIVVVTKIIDTELLYTKLFSIISLFLFQTTWKHRVIYVRLNIIVRSIISKFQNQQLRSCIYDNQS